MGDCYGDVLPGLPSGEHKISAWIQIRRNWIFIRFHWRLAKCVYSTPRLRALASARYSPHHTHSSEVLACLWSPLSDCPPCGYQAGLTGSYLWVPWIDISEASLCTPKLPCWRNHIKDHIEPEMPKDTSCTRLQLSNSSQQGWRNMWVTQASEDSRLQSSSCPSQCQGEETSCPLPSPSQIANSGGK